MVAVVLRDMLRQLFRHYYLRLIPVAPEVLRNGVCYDLSQPALEAPAVIILADLLKCLQEATIEDVHGSIPVIGITPDHIQHGTEIAPVQSFLAGTVISPAALQQY